MKRLGGIWPQVVSYENLLLGYRKARRGKGRSPGVACFALELEKELLRLQDIVVPEIQPRDGELVAQGALPVFETRP